MKRLWIQICLVGLLLSGFLGGCGPETATPDKLYGIWMGEDSGKQVTYTFILGGKCEIDYAKSGKPIEVASWEISHGTTTVKRKDGTSQVFNLKGFDLTSGQLSLHKLGMEY